MTATEILVAEHDVILTVLACLEKLVAETESSKMLDAQAAADIVDFLRNFADRCHHAKEEDRLFIVLEERGFPRHGGPTGVMLSEHAEGRSYVAAIDSASAAASQGDPASLAKFANAARGIIALLRAHIQKENQILFPMADQTLDDAAMQDLLRDFRRIEAEAGGKRHMMYIEKARKLCARFNVSFLDKAHTDALLQAMQ